ncbi:MAG: DUF4465 domain-containing protein [Proteobacteria bacterium]|nr:DUF4465 domain-containing protein [Pseudomonadota bacterium]
MKRWIILALTLFLATSAQAAVDLEDVGQGLAVESFWNGSDSAGGFTSNGWAFSNAYDAQWDSWEGFAYSNLTDNLTPGYGNQYAAASDSGAGGSATFAVSYVGWAGPPTVVLPTEQAVTGAWFNNTAYAYWTMKDGNAFAKKFGGATGMDPDWFLLTVTGKNAAGEIIGTLEVYLADFRFADNTRDYIVKDWSWVDLSSLGAVKSLEFGLTSSDTGDWGMNTPAYFAMDQAGPAAGVADMDGFALAPESFWNGSDLSGGFVSGGIHFNNAYDQDWGSWEGFAYANVSDRLTGEWSNQYAAITGAGLSGEGNYALSYVGWGGLPTVTLPQETVVAGTYVTNTAYAYWTMANGNAFAKKFGGEDGTDPDWFLLTVTGRNAAGAATGTVEFPLADFRSPDPAGDYILDQWTWLDLSSLGAVKTLEFGLTSSDTGDWGMNTPAYFALDNLNGFAMASGADADGDGVADSQRVPPGVDLDGDGTWDAVQGNMKSLSAAVGSGYLGIDLSGCVNVTRVASIQAMDTTGLPAPPAVLPYGLVSFTLGVSAPGATASVLFRLSQPILAQGRWFKYDETQGWYDYSDHATFHADGTVTLMLQDGGFGDSDGLANGVIVDPGGPGILSTAPAASGGSSGCFVGSVGPSGRAASGWLSRAWARICR